ncbi:tektin bundle-interacting protein 1-like [Rhinoraja longicauda]
MNYLEDSLYIPRRTLEADFPRTSDRLPQTDYVTANAAPVIRNSVYWKVSETDPGQMCYMELTNCNSRVTYNRWLQSYREREKASLTPAYTVQLRETNCSSATLPTQSLLHQMRWRDMPVPR